MQDHTADKYHEEREMNKFGLETFVYDMNNLFDPVIDDLIKGIKKKIENAYLEHNKWIDLKENEPVRFKELEETADRTGHSLDAQMYGYIEEASYYEDELTALYEMKVIYAYKHLEINIKKLLGAVYSDKPVNRLYKWEYLIEFLNSKNINLKELSGFKEVNELRTLNNFVKHSDGTVDSSIKNIKELKTASQASYCEFEIFYERILSSPFDFLKSLKGKIFNDVYEFSEERISEIARSFALRMNKDQANQFSAKLKDFYE